MDGKSLSNGKDGKIIRLGVKKGSSVFCKITIDQSESISGELSISGVIGPLKSGDARGSCGQILDYILPLDSYAPGWDEKSVQRFIEIWRRWHLNNMRAGCKHQREAGWDKRPIDPDSPLDSYGIHFEGQTQPSWNMLAWVTRKEHPKGLLSHPCPTCGYKYGTSWLKEELPLSIHQEIQAMPDTDKEPAWV